MRIQNNVPALNAHRYYGINQTGLTKSIAKLSSGYRINSAADDAAGLAISEKMRAQIRGLTMASKNTQDAISLIQTAEGGMQEIDNMIQRIRELVVYASNDTQDQSSTTATEGDRQKIQDEIDALTAEIDSMSERVEFNKKKLINGEFSGATETQRNTYKAAATALNTARQKMIEYIAGSAWEGALTGARTGAVGNSANAAGVEDGIELAYEAVSKALTALTADGYSEVSALFASAYALTTGAGATVLAALLTGTGTLINLFTVASTGIQAAATSFVSAKTTIDNSEIPGLYFQVGANANQKFEMSIGSVDTGLLGIGDGDGNSLINVMQTTGRSITYQLDIIDSALTYVTSQRSKLGAAQNRLEYTQSSLDISAENLTNAESRIRDVDMAKEMTTFTKMNILFQASTAMLAQANALPQGVLQMLG